MKSRRISPVKIGAFVVGGLVILVVAVIMLGSGRLFRRAHHFISFFDGSVNGLRAGASVKFKGVEVGKVDRIRIREGLTQQNDQPIAVYFSLDSDSLDGTGEHGDTWADSVQEAIAKGLRSQLEADSMVTGILFLSLAYLPETESKLHEPIEGLVEIPTIPPPLQEIGAGIRSIVDRINNYQFERVFDSFRATLDAVTELSRAPEFRSSLASLDQTLKGIDSAVRKVDEEILPLAASLKAAANRIDAVGIDLQQGIGGARSAFTSVSALSDELSMVVRPLTTSIQQTAERLEAMALMVQNAVESTRVLLDPQAPLAVELRSGLRELNSAARLARALLELLERNPSALVRGTSQEGDSK